MKKNKEQKKKIHKRPLYKFQKKNKRKESMEEIRIEIFLKKKKKKRTLVRFIIKIRIEMNFFLVLKTKNDT